MLASSLARYGTGVHTIVLVVEVWRERERPLRLPRLDTSSCQATKPILGVDGRWMAARGQYPLHRVPVSLRPWPSWSMDAGGFTKQAHSSKLTRGQATTTTTRQRSTDTTCGILALTVLMKCDSMLWDFGVAYLLERQMPMTLPKNLTRNWLFWINGRNVTDAGCLSCPMETLD